ncbi:hypothetical protein FH972_023354 [Carpinus fangiana]|uniref:Uncharacterized protein n=1 Tax=Carpinus fangiana TaxID=176857 RepID=A0A5N6KUZ3_9ROSI|nr:hypothetical protein FH972_023354 [Carpinus fangiana]
MGAKNECQSVSLGSEATCDDREWVALPDAQLREADVEVLAWVPLNALLLAFGQRHIQPQDDSLVLLVNGIIICEYRHSCLKRVNVEQVAIMVRADMYPDNSQQPHSPIQHHHNQRRYHPTRQLLPVAPASPKVQQRGKIVHLAKHLIPSPRHHAPQRKHKQHRHEQQRNAPKHHILLLHQRRIRARLRLVEVSLNQRPTKRMQHALREDDSPHPCVQKHEVLRGDAGRARQQRLARRQEDGERRQRVGQDADAVGPAAEAGAQAVLRGVALNGGAPGAVGDADGGEDEEVGEQRGEDEDLQAGCVRPEAGEAGYGEEVVAEGGCQGAEGPGEARGGFGMEFWTGVEEACEGQGEEDREKHDPEDPGVKHGEVMAVVDCVQVLAGPRVIGTGHNTVGVAPMVLDILSAVKVLEVCTRLENVRERHRLSSGLAQPKEDSGGVSPLSIFCYDGTCINDAGK